MKLAVKFALCATIPSHASPCAIVIDSNQGKQLRGGGRNTMVVTESKSLVSLKKKSS